MKYKHPPPPSTFYVIFFPTLSPVSRTAFRFVWEEDKHPTSPKVSRSKVPSEATFSHFILKQQWRRAAWRITLNPRKKDVPSSPQLMSASSRLWISIFPRNQTNKTKKRASWSPWLGLSDDINLPDAGPRPRQSLLAAPPAGGCSWHLPLEYQTASFCKRHISHKSIKKYVSKKNVRALHVVCKMQKPHPTHQVTHETPWHIKEVIFFPKE